MGPKYKCQTCKHCVLYDGYICALWANAAYDGGSEAVGYIPVQVLVSGGCSAYEEGSFFEEVDDGQGER